MTSRISTSLCRVIFESPEVHDAALLMTVLQADLTVLEELGYPGASATNFGLLQVADLFVIHQPVGDRILRQKAVREAALKAIAETEALLISSAQEMTVQETQTEIPTTQPKIPSSDSAISASSPQATLGNSGPEQTSKRSYGPGRLRLPKRLVAFSSWLTFLPKSKVIPPPSKSVPPLPSPNIPTTQPNTSSLKTPIPAPSSQTTPGNTGPEQTPKRSYRLRRHRLPNRSGASSSWPTFPPNSKVIPSQSKSVPPPPNLNHDIPEQECLSPKPGPSRDSITPLSNICMSLWTDLSGFHLILHFVSSLFCRHGHQEMHT
jgi:hypothetical protein